MIKKFITLFTIFLIVVLVSCDCEKSKSTHQEKATQSFDAVKAAKYGADDYGMKKYVMAFLKKGPNREIDSVKANELQMAHLKNIFKMADEGKLVLAGPFMDNDSIRGIYIFNVQTLEEARKLTETDPAIQAGSLVMELREWYGSAALMEVTAISKTITKKNIAE
jgi:uncharacterized protein YciI